MKIYRIIAICFLTFLLSGCAMIGLLSDMAADGESSKPSSSESAVSDKSESAETADPVKSEPKKPAAVSTASIPESEQSELFPALEGILAEAPEDCILAIVRLPDAPRFATLEKPSFTMDVSEYYPGQICETVLIVPLVDGIDISIERYELHYTIPWVVGREVLYQLDGKLGEVYAIHTFLAEGYPDMEVTASIGGKITSQTFMMDGMGGMEVEYLWPPHTPEEETFLSAPYVFSLSASAAACRMAYGDGGLWKTEDDGFWETVAYSITQIEMGDGFSDTNEGTKITLSSDRFASYVETLFPGLTAWPPWEGSAGEAYFSYNAADDTYEILYFDLPESLLLFVPGIIEEDDDGKGGWVGVEVVAPEASNGQGYEVVWREKQLRGENDPIAYEIVEIRETESYAVG